MRVAFAALLVLLTLCGCATVPDRFSRDPMLSGDGGYKMDNESSIGFSLEIFYKEYSFLPDPDNAIQGARAYFRKTAEVLAKQRGKTIIPITIADMHPTATRNILDGYYSVYVTGKVTYSTK